MDNFYPTKLVKKLTKATDNQLKYWIKLDLLRPMLIGRVYNYSFKDIITIKHIVALKNQGVSFQKIRKGINNLIQSLPVSDRSLARLKIYTNGFDIIIIEKGRFSAITGQGYLSFDTEDIKAEIITLNQTLANEADTNKQILAQR